MLPNTVVAALLVVVALQTGVVASLVVGILAHLAKASTAVVLSSALGAFPVVTSLTLDIMTFVRQ
jgi:hypothetical protein